MVGNQSTTDINEADFNIQGIGQATVAPVYSTGSQTTFTITIDGDG